jgi:hypothetical protein
VKQNQMKKFLYPVLIVALIFIAVATVISLFFLPQTSSRGLAKTEQHQLQQVSKTTPEKLPPVQANPDDIAVLKRYAESYEPKSTKHSVTQIPPEPPKKVLQTISNLANSQSREHEKYIVLIILRLSRFQIENFKQRYELGRDNPLTQEFFRIIGKSDFKGAEFLPSYLADNYVEENPELLKYPLIEKEMKRIEKAGEKLKRELDEKTRRQGERSRL